VLVLHISPNYSTVQSVKQTWTDFAREVFLQMLSLLKVAAENPCTKY
jgi:hypothetical protein